jgi:hypothetical protein
MRTQRRGGLVPDVVLAFFSVFLLGFFVLGAIPQVVDDDDELVAAIVVFTLMTLGTLAVTLIVRRRAPRRLGLAAGAIAGYLGWLLYGAAWMAAGP